MKTLGKVIGLALAALLPLSACGAATAPVNQAVEAPVALPKLTGRVVDMAGILSPAQKTILTDGAAALETRKGHQFVVVTVASLNGQAIEAYSLALARGWGIGRKGYDDGVLLVVAPNERKVRIEVGYGLERVLRDEDAARIIQETILPEFREGRLPEGISKGADAIIARLSESDQ